MIDTFKGLIGAYAPSEEDFAFVQIGANDGLRGDPLHSFIKEYDWRGVLVEPQKAVFDEQLLRNYAGNKRLAFKNAAIDATDGQRELFTLSFSTSRWATGLASFKKSHLQRHIDNGYVARMIGAEKHKLPKNKEDYISSEMVQTLSFNSLLDEFAITSLNLLQIDTEGYDYQLLQLFDFDRLKPDIIQFEVHVMSDKERQASLARLAHYNYLVFKDYINMVAVQGDVVDRLDLKLADISFATSE